WREAEALPQGHGSSAVRADALTHLGRVAHLCGRLQSALDYYEAALAASPPGTPQAQEIRLRRLLVWLDLNRPDRAGEAYEDLLAGRTTAQLPEELRPLATAVTALLGLPGPAVGDPEVQAWQAARAGDRRLAVELYRRALARAEGPVRQARLALA